MRVMVGNGKKEIYEDMITSRDIIVIPNLFCEREDLTIYNKILSRNSTG